MSRIRYVEIENFKTFSHMVHIDLGQPAVLIGPNNAGKTSVINPFERRCSASCT
jgi:AAA15 family ATPase/GTPase